MKNRNEVLKKALKSAGVSQDKLAEKLGVGRTAITERLNGDREIDDFEFIKAVSELTGVSVAVFLGSVEEIPVETPDKYYQKYIRLLEEKVSLLEEELAKYKPKKPTTSHD
jgi:transcriptional regulator with XRE-family HTH domain